MAGTTAGVLARLKEGVGFLRDLEFFLQSTSEDVWVSIR